MIWFQSDVFGEPGDLPETHLLILHSATASPGKCLKGCCVKHYFLSIWIHILGSDSSASLWISGSLVISCSQQPLTLLTWSSAYSLAHLSQPPPY